MGCKALELRIQLGFQEDFLEEVTATDGQEEWSLPAMEFQQAPLPDAAIRAGSIYCV